MRRTIRPTRTQDLLRELLQVRAHGIVTEALGFLVHEPSRDAVCASLRNFAARLQPLDPLQRKAAALEAEDRLKQLGVAASEAHQLVEASLHQQGRQPRPDNRQGREISVLDPEPWPEPVSLADVLDEAVGGGSRR